MLVTEIRPLGLAARSCARARCSRPTLPELFKLRLSAQGHYADFELRANSVDNPFDLKMFASFACPDRF